MGVEYKECIKKVLDQSETDKTPRAGLAVQFCIRSQCNKFVIITVLFTSFY